jgi:hypothetical protein
MFTKRQFILMIIEMLKINLAQFNAALGQFYQMVETWDDSKVLMASNQDPRLRAAINVQVFEFAQRTTHLMQWQEKFTEALDHISRTSLSALDVYSRCQDVLREKHATLLTGVMPWLSDICQRLQSNAITTEYRQQAWPVLAELYFQLKGICEVLFADITRALSIPFVLPAAPISNLTPSMALRSDAMVADPDAQQGCSKRSRYH